MIGLGNTIVRSQVEGGDVLAYEGAILTYLGSPINLDQLEPEQRALIRGALEIPASSHTIQFSPSEVSPPSPVLPSAGSRADGILSFDADGDLIIDPI